MRSIDRCSVIVVNVIDLLGSMAVGYRGSFCRKAGQGVDGDTKESQETKAEANYRPSTVKVHVL